MKQIISLRKSMRFFTRFLKIAGYFFLLLLACIIGFLLWNNYPPLPSKTFLGIQIVPEIEWKSPPPILKVASYNIQYGIGLNGNRTDALRRKDFYDRLERLAEVLKEIDADIVFLQEVDFYARRSQFFDQGSVLAEKAGYPYLAEAPHWKRKLFPFWNGIWGPLNHGLCVLSRFPLIENEARVFEHPQEAPFYVRWIYSPHGAQRAVVQVGKEKITLLNVHLEPWAQKTREKSVKNLVEWIKELPGPILLGGDFNAIPPEAPEKTVYNLEDAPWFIDKNQWKIEKDTTIKAIRELGFSEAIPEAEYLQNEEAAFTYPADSPKQKIDYLFAGKGAKILKGWVFKESGIASDHLPIVANVSYLENPVESTPSSKTTLNNAISIMRLYLNQL